jgi:ATP-binding cassette, subfamily B, bacterial
MTESRSNSEPNHTWKSRLASVHNIKSLFVMLWQTSPFLFIGTIAVRVGRAVLPIALLWIPKQILDGVIAVLRGHGNIHHVWWLLAMELSLALIADLLSQANTVLDALLGERFTTHVALKLIEHVSTLDLATFEDAVFYDKLERVRGQATGRMFLLTSLMNAGLEAATLATLSVGLTIFSPWLAVLLVAATIPTFVGEARFSRLSYSAFYRRTPQRRQLEYLRLLGSWADSAKEVRVFRLASYLLNRYRILAEDIYKENAELAIARALGGWLLGLLAVVGYYGGYIVVLRSVLAAAISIGTFTFLTGSLARSRMSTERVFSYLNGVADQALLLTDLFEIFTLTPTIASSPHALAIPTDIRKGFEFRNVSFMYPGTNTCVVRNLSFTISPSERVALVGENGAGKTTIVKLLARLYEPTTGQILFDGVDLRQYDLDALRACISVIFQDYMRYDLTVRENIGVGDIASLADTRRVRSAASRAGLDKIVDRFMHGYDQMLGRRFKDGVDLSGGEWQKVALARSFAGNPKLLIFDEPTSSLDARAEEEFLRYFRNRREGPMAVLISHKLSSVRWADKVIVLEKGQVCETGTHEELIAMGGRYASLFQLQAAAFWGTAQERYLC